MKGGVSVTPPITSKRISLSPAPPGSSATKKGSTSLNRSLPPPRTQSVTPPSRTPADQASYRKGSKHPLGGADVSPLSRHPLTKQKDSTPPSTNQGSVDAGIAATLKEISNTLSKVVSQMDRQESRLDSIEKKLASRSSVSSSSGDSCSKKVPPIIRVSECSQLSVNC